MSWLITGLSVLALVANILFMRADLRQLEQEVYALNDCVVHFICPVPKEPK